MSACLNLDPIHSHLLDAPAGNDPAVSIDRALSLIGNDSPDEEARKALRELIATDDRLAIASAGGLEVVLLCPKGMPIPAGDVPAADCAPDATPAAAPADESDEVAKLRAEISALHRERDAAKQIADEIEDARRDWEDLKERAKNAKERMDTLAESLAKLVRGDVQTELGEFKDGPQQTTLNDAIANPQAERAPDNGGEAIEIVGLNWAAVKLSALSTLASTGKPPQVKPIEQAGALLILTDVQDRVAIMHPLFDAKVFDGRYDETKRKALPSELESGQTLGFPVRVGRKKYWLGDADTAWRVQIPADAKIGGEVIGDETLADMTGEEPAEVAAQA